MTKVLLVGDVGLRDGRFHVGDEAMFAAAVEELRRRGVGALSATSVTPFETSERYGVEAVGRLDFSQDRTPRHDDREDRLDRIVRSARGETGLLEWRDPAWTVIEQVAAADAVLICGGGNLSSTWPEHVYERVAMVRLSAVFSCRLVVSGQTLGPALTQRDGELVAEIIASSVLAGVREGGSHEVARALGEFSHVTRTIDDAAFLEAGHAPGTESPTPGSYCLATFAPYAGSAPQADYIRRIAQFLDDVVSITDLDIVLLAHDASLDPGVVDGDREIHRRIAAAMTSDRVAEVGLHAPSVSVALARDAGLSVSSRYHSAVFALANGVPSITFATDDYTDVKLAGALENFGFADGALSSVALATDDARATLERIWHRRVVIREHLAAVAAARRTRSDQWWDLVAPALRGEPVAPLTWWASPVCDVLTPSLRERNTRLRAWVRDEGRARIGAEIARRGSSDDLAALRAELLASENALGEAMADVELASQRAAEAEAALAAAQALLTQIADPVFARTLRTHPTVVRADEMAAMLNSRTFRWTSRPRAVYGRVRRWLIR